MAKTIYLTKPGRLSRKDNTLKFQPTGEDGEPLGKPKILPIKNVSDIFCLSQHDFNSSLFNFLGQQSIQLHCFDYYGNYTGTYCPRDYLQAGQVRIQQTQAYLEPTRRLRIAQRFVAGALLNIRQNLKYYQNRGKDLQQILQAIEQAHENIPHAQDIEELMGIEGNMRLLYYTGWETILGGHLKFGHRSRQPPHNELNALISFANSLCYVQCLKALYHTQLDPTISYLHQPGYRRYSLALDLAEIFKPLLADRLIFQLVNRRQITQTSFQPAMGGTLLRESARITFLRAWDERLNQTIKHRELNRKISYQQLVRLEGYKLVKHLLGIKTYTPFKIWW